MFRTLPTALLLVAVFTGSIIITSVAQVQAATCGTSIAPSAQAGLQASSDAYQQWKASYVTANGANGQLRVQRSANDNYDTVSEGIAYGMLFAVYNNDRTTFDKLWAYEQAHLDPNGLMHWRISAGGDTTGHNAATDADEDMALALIVADRKWGGYAATAKKQIQIMERTEIEHGTNVLKPGDVWGGNGLMNPSYLSPSYYPLFKAYSGNAVWDGVTTASYNTFKAIRQNTPARNTGLIPDWSNSNGYPVNGMGYQYSYDAVRTPIRLALASNWTCDAGASDALAPFNSFFQRTGVQNIVAGYNLDGSRASSGGVNSAFVAAAASGAITSSDAAYRSSAWSTLVNSPRSDYYNDSVRLLGLMTASGTFSNPAQVKPVAAPVTVTPTTPTTTTPAPIPTTPTPILTPTTPTAPTTTMSKLGIWWPSDGSAVTGTQPFKAMLQDNQVENYTMYWQVDGGVLNQMANNYEGYPHKQSVVNVSGWNWRGAGPYTITFVAKNSAGTIIGTNSTKITIK